MAAAVLILGGYLVWDKASTFLPTFGEVPDYPGPGNAKITVDIPTGASLDVIGGILVSKGRDQVDQGLEHGRPLRGAGDQRAGRQLPDEDPDAGDRRAAAADQPRRFQDPAQFTVPEGLRLTAQVDALAKGTKIKKASYLAALGKPKSLGLPKYAKKPARGFPLPRHL